MKNKLILGLCILLLVVSGCGSILITDDEINELQECPFTSEYDNLQQYCDWNEEDTEWCEGINQRNCVSYDWIYFNSSEELADYYFSNEYTDLEIIVRRNHLIPIYFGNIQPMG